MRGNLDRETYQELYRLLDQVNPVPFDCGALCQKICCQETDRQMGMYLMPNEHLLFDGTETWLVWEKHRAKDYDFPAGWSGDVYFLRCNGKCQRRKRPLQCRTFPLAPYLPPGGKLVLIWETMVLPYRCPLIEQEFSLEQSYLETLYKVLEILINDPLIRDLIAYDSRLREDEGQTCKVIYPGAELK